MAKKVLVLGGCGFVGSNICKTLRDKHEISGIDNLSFGSTRNVFTDMIFANVRHIGREFLNKYDIIVSSFCSNIIYSGENPNETYKNNILGALNCFQKFDGYVINLSTSSVYGNATVIPTPETQVEQTNNAYDTSKLIIEEYLKLRGNYTTLRLSNVYGEYQRPDKKYCGVVAKFIYSYFKNEEAILYGNDTRDYTYVGDVVNAVEKCIETYPLNTEINIGTGIETSTMTLLELIGVERGLECTPRNIDGISRRCLDIRKAYNLLGWKPKTNLVEGIEITKNWIKKEYFENT